MAKKNLEKELRFSKEFLVKQKAKLEKEQKSLTSELNKTRKYPDYGTSEDENVQEVEEFEQGLGLQKNLRQLQKDTKLALARIEQNKYGICEICHKPIELGRLKAMPTATKCAEDAEKDAKKSLWRRIWPFGRSR